MLFLSLTVFDTVSGVSVLMTTLVGNTSTATAGVHFLDISTTVRFLAGETTMTIAIPIYSIPGYSDEDCTFVVRLSNPENASIAVPSATMTIVNVHSPRPGAPIKSSVAATVDSISLQV